MGKCITTAFEMDSMNEKIEECWSIKRVLHWTKTVQIVLVKEEVNVRRLWVSFTTELVEFCSLELVKVVPPPAHIYSAVVGSGKQ